MTAREVMEKLHPTLDKQHLPKNDKFLPGFKSYNDIYKDPSKIKNVTSKAAEEFKVQKDRDMLMAEGSIANSRS
jgi:hypothetical protein